MERGLGRGFLRCKRCDGTTLHRTAAGVTCASAGTSRDRRPRPARGPARHRHGRRGGPASGTLDEVARRVRRFYEENPFPNYDGYESVGDLLSRASRSVYADALDRQIPVGARVLEIGCGTGQLGAFLSIGGRAVVGVDMTRASLELAGGFKQRHGLRNATFSTATSSTSRCSPNSFDLVIAKGVLMATRDARGAFHAICKLPAAGRLPHHRALQSRRTSSDDAAPVRLPPDQRRPA